jgi:endonuclease G, mitochondrial
MRCSFRMGLLWGSIVASIGCQPPEPNTPQQECKACPPVTPPQGTSPPPDGSIEIEDHSDDAPDVAHDAATRSASTITVFERGDAPAQRESLKPEERRWLAENCYQGAPKKLKNFGATTVVAREPLALEHSDRLKIPLWVCEHVVPQELRYKRAKRAITVKIGSKKKKVNLISFLPDPKLASGTRAELSDYSGSGFDRGHMAPAADFTWMWGAMESSFYLSNMAPQVGDGFNRGVWKLLEEQVRKYVGTYKGAWIITGGFWRDGGSVDTIGSSAVAVPTHFYKVVVVKDQGTHHATAFVLKNEKQANTKDFQTFVESIDDLETWTGLDFMPELSSGDAATLERDKADLTTW